jgi:hypothetical protein
MRKLCIVVLGVFFALLVIESPSSLARANAFQNSNSSTTTNTNRKMNVPHRRRHVSTDRRKHKGIGHAYKGAGKSAARGGKRFGKNIRHGKPIKGGRELGRGMGGMGKGVGKGTGRVGRKVGHKIKKVVKP